MKIFLLILLSFGTISAFAVTDYYGIKCSYNDVEEEKQARFSFVGDMSVTDKNSALLSYNALIHFVPGSDYSDDSTNHIDNNIVFATDKNLKNSKYNGRKYNNHFKFELKWTSVGGDIEYADIIISKEPVETKKDEYGATIQVFNGALDVSYNDHHGDSVWIKCERRFFDR